MGPEVKDHYNRLVKSFEKTYGIKTEYTHGDWFAAQQQVLGDVENNVPDGKIDVIFLWGKPFSNLLQGNGVWEVPILDLLPNARKIAYRPELGRFVHDMVPTYGAFVPHVNWQNCYVYDKSKYQRSDMPDDVLGVLDWAKAHKGEFTYCDFNKGGSGHTFGMMLIYGLTGGYSKYAFRPYDEQLPEKDWGPLWEFLNELEEYCYQPGTYPQGNADHRGHLDGDRCRVGDLSEASRHRVARCAVIHHQAAAVHAVSGDRLPSSGCCSILPDTSSISCRC